MSDAPKVPVSAPDLIAWLGVARNNGRVDAWADVAVEWIRAVDEKIEELEARIAELEEGGNEP